MLHEGLQRLVRQFGFVKLHHVPNLLQHHIHFLRSQAGQANDGAEHVHQPIASEWVFRQPRPKRLVAIEPALGIRQEIRRAAHYETDIGGVPLQHIVQNPEDLLIIRFSGLRRTQLVEIHHLVERY